MAGIAATSPSGGCASSRVACSRNGAVGRTPGRPWHRPHRRSSRAARGLHLHPCGDAAGNFLHGSPAAHRHGAGSALPHARRSAYTDPRNKLLLQNTDNLVPAKKRTKTTKEGRCSLSTDGPKRRVRPTVAAISQDEGRAAGPGKSKAAINRDAAARAASLRAVVIDALDDMKALEIKVLDVRGLTDVADTMVIA